MTITLTHYLVLGAILFCLGVYGALTRRNAIGILMSLELVFNAVNLNLVAASRWQPFGGLLGSSAGTAAAQAGASQGGLVGQLFALFVIAAAAAESVLGLALILAIYRRRLVVNADEMDLMKN